MSSSQSMLYSRLGKDTFSRAIGHDEVPVDAVDQSVRIQISLCVCVWGGGGGGQPNPLNPSAPANGLTHLATTM